jgi:hypothetical protein
VAVPLSQYREQIASLLKDKNAIVIASPDVNPMTELLLGRLYAVPDSELFTESFEAGRYPRAVAALKKRKKDNTEKGRKTGPKPPGTGRFFFIEKQNTKNIEERGFRAAWLKGNELLQEYLGQKACRDNNFKLYAHLVIALNPFSSPEETKEQGIHYVVILNGISGPSTFALTHLLTGGIGKEFVDYTGRPVGRRSRNSAENPPFDPNMASESILSKVTDQIDQYVSEESDFCGVQMIVEVTVGPPAAQQYLTFDSRRVKKWRFVPGSLKLIEKTS